ncbi:MAG: GNAT family N-acetyltransferase [Pseudomonadales bacterium]|nr:GNAT family N-acetyltransferase [Pseudomonadales bacterium]
MLALEHRADGLIACFEGLVPPGGQGLLELKYAPWRIEWGLVAEAAAATLRWGREAHGLEEIIAGLHPRNRALRRALERAGVFSGTAP